MRRSTSATAASELRARLEARRGEIEAAVLTRIVAIADPAEIADPAYAEGLRRSIAAAIGFGFETLERSGGAGPPIPVELLAQARLAARNGIAVDTVLRRYFAGYSLLGFFTIEEASRVPLLAGEELQRLTGAQAANFDRLMAAVAEEHARESESLRSAAERMQTERVQRLLEGQLVDTGDIPYDFEGWHTGAIVTDAEAAESLRALAQELDCRLLLVRLAEGTAWAWLGSNRRRDPAELIRCASVAGTGPGALVLGEPARGLDGWRLTHRQALAALAIARRLPGAPIRYADVALVATVAHDDLLAASLAQLFLAPLESCPADARTLRQTLRLYLRTAGNISSTAAALGVKRQTVTRRLRMVEEAIERPLDRCATEIDVALRLEELGRQS